MLQLILNINCCTEWKWIEKLNNRDHSNRKEKNTWKTEEYCNIHTQYTVCWNVYIVVCYTQKSIGQVNQCSSLWELKWERKIHCILNSVFIKRGTLCFYLLGWNQVWYQAPLTEHTAIFVFFFFFKFCSLQVNFFSMLIQIIKTAQFLKFNWVIYSVNQTEFIVELRLKWVIIS